MKFPNLNNDVISKYLKNNTKYVIDGITFKFEIDSSKEPDMFNQMLEMLQFDRNIAERMMVKMAESALFDNDSLKANVDAVRGNVYYKVYDFEVVGIMKNAVGTETPVPMDFPYENGAVVKRIIRFCVEVQKQNRSIIPA